MDDVFHVIGCDLCFNHAYLYINAQMHKFKSFCAFISTHCRALSAFLTKKVRWDGAETLVRATIEATETIETEEFSTS